MKLDFLESGNADPLPRKFIERRMRLLDIEPLDSPRRTVRIGLIALAALLAVFLIFALFAPISAAAIAPAVVSVSGERFSVQPAASGIVTEFLVREGQTVRSGQPLVRLNGVRSGAQLRQIQARRDALQALEARLIAERDRLDRISFPAGLSTREGDPAVTRMMTAQRLIFDRLRAKTTIVSMEQNEAQLVAEAASGRAAIAQSQIAARKVRDGESMDAAMQLNQVQDQIAQISPQIDVTRYLADQDVICAPVAGRVSGVTRMGAGMVIGGGKTLMDIVPDSRPLILEAQVKPADIDDVRIGQPATVRFSSVNPHGRTAFDGRVVTLSPAPVSESGASYYKAEVVLLDPAEARREGLTLQPGIPASVNIKARGRSLFQYLFGPFTDATSHAFREE